jgi:hypothetical protein
VIARNEQLLQGGGKFDVKVLRSTTIELRASRRAAIKLIVTIKVVKSL